MAIDLYTPFDTYLIEHPDFNQSDTMSEIEALFLRQRAIEGLVQGTLDAEYVLDVLEFQGIDPTTYVDSVQENVDLVICSYG